MNPYLSAREVFAEAFPQEPTTPQWHQYSAEQKRAWENDLTCHVCGATVEIAYRWKHAAWHLTVDREAVTIDG